MNVTLIVIDVTLVAGGIFIDKTRRPNYLPLAACVRYFSACVRHVSFAVPLRHGLKKQLISCP